MARLKSICSSIIQASGLGAIAGAQLERIIEGSNEDEFLILGALLYAMNPSPYVLFLGDGEWILVTPWGCQASSFVKNNRHTGERLPFVNELMPSRFELSDRELREFFCLLELSLFKLLELHEAPSVFGKAFEKLTLGDLRREVRKAKLLSAPALDALDKIVETRNEFNHSMRKVRDVTYCGVPLYKSHSSRYLPRRNRDPSVRRFFIDDAFTLTEEVVSVYRLQQSKLVDGEILSSFLRGDLTLLAVNDAVIHSMHRDTALEERHWQEWQAME